MISYELDDNVSPYLRKLFKVSVGLGLQAQSKAGHVIRDKMSAKSKSMSSHRFGQKIENGRRTLLSSKHGYSKKLYSRVSHSDGSRQADMGDLVRYKLYPLSHTLLVGWINVKSFNTTFFKGGVPTKGNFVKGTQTKEIASRMAKGGRVYLSDKQKGLFTRSGWYNAVRKGYVDRKAHPFMNFSSYITIANTVAQKEFKQAIREFKKRHKE